MPTQEIPVHIAPPVSTVEDFTATHAVAIQQLETPGDALAYSAAMLRRIEDRDIAALGLVIFGCAQAIVTALEAKRPCR